MELNKELLKDFGEKASEMTNVVKLKFEIKNKEKEFKKKLTNLGEIIVKGNKDKNFNPESDEFLKQITAVKNSEDSLKKLKMEYEDIRMDSSDSFVIKKLLNDFAETGSLITQVYVSENSNVVGKKLKSLRFPKETLISAIKRNEEMIIPDGSTILLANDNVFVVGKKEDVEQLVKRLGGE